MIYVDVSAAVHSRAGLGRYSASLADALARSDRLPDSLALFHNGGHDDAVPPVLRHLPQRHVGYGYKPWRMAVWLAHLSRISFNRLVPDARLFHSTEHLLMPLRDVPTVLTIHDLIFKIFPEHHKKLNYWFLNWAVPLFCERADAIVAVSEATRRDIVTHYGVNPGKITVIQEAAGEHFRVPGDEARERVRRRYELPDRYLLHLSTIEPRKNLDRLVDAFLAVQKEYPDLQLLLVGSKGWLYEDFFARLEREQLTGAVRHLGWVPDEDLPAVIAEATVAVQPSLYEGFGLPLLEHMACGTVVAASNSSSLPEVGGEAAAYFDPTDSAAMAAVVRRLLDDPEERQARRAAGLAQAARFSWDRAARETIQLYETLLA